MKLFVCRQTEPDCAGATASGVTVTNDVTILDECVDWALGALAWVTNIFGCCFMISDDTDPDLEAENEVFLLELMRVMFGFNPRTMRIW